MFAPAFSPLRFGHVIPRIVVPLVGLLLVVSVGNSAARAADKTFVIADNEGYGIMDCITEGKSCGRVVADAWCESHGYGAARAFGRASDITGAIPVSTNAPAPAPADAAVVSCGD